MSGVVRERSQLHRWWAQRRTLWAMSLMNWAWRTLTAPKDRREIALWFIAHLEFMLDTKSGDRIEMLREMTWWERRRGMRRLVVVDKTGRVRQERIVRGDLTLVINDEDATGFVVQEQGR